VIKLPNQSWVLLKGFRSCKSGSKIVTDLWTEFKIFLHFFDRTTQYDKYE
jgi:hypothetical protein